MRSMQHNQTKQQNRTTTRITNMKGSRLKGTEKKDEELHDIFLGSRYQIPSEKHRALKVERMLEAFKTLAKEAPDVFDSIAPEMLQRSIWSWRGADPLLSKKFNNWVLSEYQWSSFSDILPKHESANPVEAVPRVDPAQLEAAHRAFLEAMSNRFYGDPHRWDASTRDQFIIIGVLASARGHGVRQGVIVNSLGLGMSESGVRGSNTVRAAKIALTRLAKPLGLQLFAPASGHGGERIHAFDDPDLAEIVHRFIQHHDARMLLPGTALVSASKA
jgi:hypothetical protein